MHILIYSSKITASMLKMHILIYLLLSIKMHIFAITVLQNFALQDFYFYFCRNLLLFLFCCIDCLYIRTYWEGWHGPVWSMLVGIWCKYLSILFVYLFLNVILIISVCIKKLLLLAHIWWKQKNKRTVWGDYKRANLRIWGI